MVSTPPSFVLLPGTAGWDGRPFATEVDASGALCLARIPAGNATLSPHADSAPSLVPFAVSKDGQRVFWVDSSGRLHAHDAGCEVAHVVLEPNGDRADEPRFHAVTGLALTEDRLFVADAGSGAVFVFALPALVLTAVWREPFSRPSRVGVDGRGGIYVLDTGFGRVLRLSASGRVDAAYTSVAIPRLVSGLDLAIATDGTAFLSAAGAATVLRLSPTGATLAPIPAPESARDFQPSALAIVGERLYVADHTSGSVWAYDSGAHAWLARIPGFTGPVRGLATDGVGALYVRTNTAGNEPYVKLAAGAACAPLGWLELGPFDAGEGGEWLRVQALADEPEQTRVSLEVALAEVGEPGVPSAPPTASWRVLPALDALVAAPAAPDTPSDPTRRLLWLRVTLECDDGTRSPTVKGLRLETRGRDPLADLPAIYARADEPDGFLRRWLLAVGAELHDRELAFAELAQCVDPAVAPRDQLPWLASWIAADLPVGTHEATQRRYLLDAYRLHAKRGTPDGLREMVRAQTGIKIRIDESFRHRHLWALGRSELGFDTGLLPTLPDGMVVPGPSFPDPALQGLLTEYFPEARVDYGELDALDGASLAALHADWPSPSVEKDGHFASFAVPTRSRDRVNEFAVTWSGQLRVPESALYTFYFFCSGGARLYVDGQLLIDSWGDPGKRELRGEVPLAVDHWYPLRIEYWTRTFRELSAVPRPQLSWAFGGTAKRIVASEYLYARLDDNIAFGTELHDGSDSTSSLIVGEAIVGSHGPLEAEDFGSPLFADTAHEFAVHVQAHDLRRPELHDALVRVLDSEKPAHTEYRLCVVEPSFLVGFQDRVGIDAIVAPEPQPGRYGESALGEGARLGDALVEDRTLRVEETLRIGSDAILR